MTDNELKPCPFCGSSKVGCEVVFIARAWVAGCYDCGAQTGRPEGQERDAAVAAWNRRVSGEECNH